MTPAQAKSMKSKIADDRSVADITPDDVSEWVMDEFCALQDMFEVAARIEHEKAVIADNAHRSHIFPMTQFAHEALLSELQHQLCQMMEDSVAVPRTLN